MPSFERDFQDLDMRSKKLVAPIRTDPSWPLVRLSSLAKKIGSGATPKGGQAAYQLVRNRFALVRSQNVFDREFNDEGLAFISDEQACELRHVWLEKEDLLLNITGDGVTFGRSCRVPDSVLPACVNQHVSIIRIDKESAHPGYVLSYLTHPAIKKYIEGFNAGGSRRAVTKAHIESFLIPLPPPEVQVYIAETLSCLDDRIALLRETNTTLEGIAHALFKSWFVDFDPVRARMDGRQPEGMDEATASLFPHSFNGLVPSGWKRASLYDAADVVYGAPFASKLFNSDGLGKPLIRIRDLRDESPSVFTPEQHPKGYLVEPGDIVVGMDGEFRAYLWGGEQAWLNQRVCVFRPKQGIPSAFLRESLIPLLRAVEESETATTVIHLGKNDIDRFALLFPDKRLLARFGELTDGLYRSIVAGKQRARTLATLRDTLLPRLMSGQLRIPDATAEVAQVA